MPRAWAWEAAALSITSFLNDPRGAPAGKARLRRIHRLLVEIGDLTAGLPKHTPKEWRTRRYRLARWHAGRKWQTREGRLAREKAAQLNTKLLARYKAHPHFAVVGESGGWSPIGGHKDLMEFVAVTYLLALPPEQWRRLRTCKVCGKWFHARFSHAIFCTEACRLKHYASAEEWKKYRAKKALEYYHLHSKKTTR